VTFVLIWLQTTASWHPCNHGGKLGTRFRMAVPAIPSTHRVRLPWQTSESNFYVIRTISSLPLYSATHAGIHFRRISQAPYRRKHRLARHVSRASPCQRTNNACVRDVFVVRLRSVGKVVAVAVLLVAKKTMDINSLTGLERMQVASMPKLFPAILAFCLGIVVCNLLEQLRTGKLSPPPRPAAQSLRRTPAPVVAHGHWHIFETGTFSRRARQSAGR
jgi:hypothetical protein